MQQLIPIVNKLHDVFTTVGMRPLELPQLVVVGSQSSGKSSVLENIVGRDFLPRGSNIVTRRPLILQLINTTHQPQDLFSEEAKKASEAKKDNEKKEEKKETPADKKEDDSKSSVVEERKERKTKESKEEAEEKVEERSNSGEEWGEFLHKKGEKFTNFDQIRQEIVRETDALCGSKNVSSKPINLRIYSPHVLNLTLVDLPGVTKIAMGDQPTDIEKQIRDMIWEYISPANSIIVAVSPANSDLANSDALKLAKEADPNGVRTLGVITKIDLMDRGTDCLDILQNKVYPLTHGYVGVINRSQEDINHKKSIQAALKSERMWFQQSQVYRPVANQCGTAFLAKRLNQILMKHIQDCLPEMRMKIAHTIAGTQEELEAFGNPLLNSRNQLGPLLLHLLSKFCNNYCDALDGRSPDVSITQLYGGARINYIFNDVFSRRLDSINPFDELTDQDIRTAIRNATGPRPSLFIPEVSFELLVKRQIERLQSPSLQCVDLVFDELKRVAAQCEGAVQELQRFPVLKEQLFECVRGLLEQRLRPTKTMINNLIHIELAYINTNHPDFIGGSNAISSMMDKMAQNQKQGKSDELKSPIVPKKPGLVSPLGDANTFMHLLYNHSKTGSNASSSSSSSGSSSSARTLLRLEDPRPQNDTYPRPVQTLFAPVPTDKEIIETEIIKSLISSYFNIVRKNIQDAIPKAIMYFLVNHSKGDIQSELVRTLYKENLFEALLKEADDVAQKRAHCQMVLKVMRKALDIVNQVRDYNAV